MVAGDRDVFAACGGRCGDGRGGVLMTFNGLSMLGYVFMTVMVCAWYVGSVRRGR